MLKTRITQAFHNSEQIDKSVLKKDLQEVLTGLNNGSYRIAEKKHGQWITHSWLKESILLALRFFTTEISDRPIGYDKIPQKCCSWDEQTFQKAGFRMVPGAIVRFGAFIAPKVILMPSFINIGAYIDEGTMIDTWATVGSCAQIGKNVHISGGVGIGGVLEPVQNNPVIIEDNCFIGARSEIAEGITVEEGAVISMGVFLSASTKIINRNTGHISYGRIPAYSVVIPGTLPGKDPKSPQMSCAIIVKTVDEKTRKKTSINELLRY